MHPVLFRVPGLDFPIRTFGVMVACGILLSIWMWGKFLARHGDDPRNDPERGSQVAVWVVVGVLLGARFVYVTVEVLRYATADVSAPMRAYLDAPPEKRRDASAALTPDELETTQRIAVGHDFVHDPLKMLMIWQGGLVMYGGLMGGILFGVWSCRKHGLDPWNSLDTGLVCGFFGLVLGRWGCLLVGDDYGRVVSDAWTDGVRPVHFGNGGEVGFLTLRVPDLEWLLRNPESLFDKDLAGKVLWATQVWMSLNALCIALLGWVWLKHRRHVGVPAALMLLQYAVCRFTIEIFRGDEVRGIWFGGRLSTSQILSMVLFALASWMLVVRRRTPARARPA